MHHGRRCRTRRPRYPTCRDFRLPPHAAEVPTGSACRQEGVEFRGSHSSTIVREMCRLATEKPRSWLTPCNVHSWFVFPPLVKPMPVILRLIFSQTSPDHDTRID